VDKGTYEARNRFTAVIDLKKSKVKKLPPHLRTG
jgi:hypothetical protein